MRSRCTALLVLTAALAVAARADEPITDAPGDPVAADALPSASIALADDVKGEIALFDDEGNLVARLLGPEEHPFSIRVRPGRYSIECRTKTGTSRAAIVAREGEELLVDRDRLVESEGDQPRPWRRGWRPRAPRADELDLRRFRATIDAGFWSSSTSNLPTITISDHSLESEGGGFLGGMSFGYRVTPEWMFDLRLENRILEAHEHARDVDGLRLDHAAVLTSFGVGLRYYPEPMASHSAVKPYLSAGLGPTLALDITDRHHGWRSRYHHGDDVRTMVALGARVGAGLDLQATSWLVIGTDIAYHFTSDFSEPLAGHEDGSGFTFAFQLGVNFGKRMKKPAH